jgi:hypothetical protein
MTINITRQSDDRSLLAPGSNESIRLVYPL